MKVLSYLPLSLFLTLPFSVVCESAEKYGYTVRTYEIYDTDDTTLADYVFPEYDENLSEPPAAPSLAVTRENGDGSPQALTVSIGKPFTVMQAREGHVVIHPVLTHLGDGKILLQVHPDMDISDSEELVVSSSDGGKTWEEVSNWPLGDGRGRHIWQRHKRLPDGGSFIAPIYIVSTGRENEYIIPAHISSNDGTSFTRIDPKPFKLNWGTVYDYQDLTSPGQKRGGPRNFMPDFGKVPGKPSQLMQDFRAEFGEKWLNGYLWELHSLDSITLLAFINVRTGSYGPEKRSRHNVVCLVSKDRGRSWALRSVPGPFDTEFDEKNRRKKPLDGLVEPSVTRLQNGDHLIVMRIGAWQRLYSAVSKDDCRTWSKPREISVFGIVPTVLTLPDGTLALCSGRPDNTLSFSFDDGYTWPWTVKLLDQTLPEHTSTRNNTMIQVAPGRLLYMYDMGYRRPHPEVEAPHAIRGVFIDVASTR